MERILKLRLSVRVGGGSGGGGGGGGGGGSINCPVTKFVHGIVE